MTFARGKRLFSTPLLWAAASFLFFSTIFSTTLRAQPYGQPDTAAPGDPMIQAYLAREAARLDAGFLDGIRSREDWLAARPGYLKEYFYMLGLSPLPAKSDLHAATTRVLDRGDYLVEMVHFQSVPGLYVTGNLYRPKEGGERKLPALVYVCGHASRGRNGNKTAYQSHGIWLARHGYICLMIDTVQLGEIAGMHHGTYRENRWWWLSRGYTPAGVECWNGVRAVDYLVARPDVDPDRIGVTGISGGGAATYWIAAADERVKIAAAVSGMADLDSYVSNRVVNGHCDCMFLYNTCQWPWTRIAGLLAPRPFLFVNSDQDDIFPMDANERVINRLERLYSFFGAGDRVDAIVSVGGHDYRRDIREGTFRFFNTWFKADPRIITDSETDLVIKGKEPFHPIEPEQLRVFPNDSDIRSDALNARIDESFVPMGEPDMPKPGGFKEWKQAILSALRETTFRYFPKTITAAREIKKDSTTADTMWLETEQGITVRMRKAGGNADGKNVVLWVAGSDGEFGRIDDIQKRFADAGPVFVLEPRGFGATKWTRKNPPNYVERAHFLLGRTVDAGRVWDVIAAAKYLSESNPGRRITLGGEKLGAGLALTAAALSETADELNLLAPPKSFMEPQAPQFLQILRTCDIPHLLGLVAEVPVELSGPNTAQMAETARKIARAAAMKSKIHLDNK